MWFLTKTGVRAVTDLAETEPSCALLDGVTFTNSGRRRGIVPLVAAYRALAASSATFASRPIVRVWEQPWIRWYQSSADRVVRVRLPAGVVLESSTAVLQPIVLLPDTGTRPVASYRTTLRRFGELERQSRGDELPYLMIVLLEAADCEARAAAWSGFIARHLGPGYARVISETRVRDRWMISRAETPRKPSSIPQADTMLDLMARHPLLTCDQLATLLDASRRRVSALQTELVRRGWLRQLTADATRLDPTPPRHPRLFELTLAGRRQSLRRLGLMSTDAARHHGHLPHRSTARRRLLRHLAHTVGANQFFVDLALIARRITLAGGDDELLEWRSAAACARGKCRPDGYGCYRRGDARYGFFVEYDRATERAREYAAKLDAYYRFRDTARRPANSRVSRLCWWYPPVAAPRRRSRTRRISPRNDMGEVRFQCC